MDTRVADRERSALELTHPTWGTHQHGARASTAFTELAAIALKEGDLGVSFRSAAIDTARTLGLIA